MSQKLNEVLKEAKKVSHTLDKFIETAEACLDESKAGQGLPYCCLCIGRKTLDQTNGLCWGCFEGKSFIKDDNPKEQ